MLKLVTAILVWLLSLVFTVPASASFSLSVTPYEGGFDLNFGKTDSFSSLTREVVFRITSDTGKQYQLTQSLAEPLSNAAGVVIPYQNIAVSSVPGSNRTGTLRVDHETIVGPGMQVLFTSNTQGSPEQFTLVYALKSPLSVPGGQYRGRIVFSLEAVDGSEPPQRVFLNVLAEVQSSKSIEIRTATDSKTITLGKETAQGQGTEVYFNMKSDYGAPFKIFQFVDTLRSAEGNELSPDAVQFSVQGAQKGSAPANPVSLTSGDSLVYASSPAGSGESFTVVYSLVPGTTVKAGRYQGKLRYHISSVSSQDSLETFVLEVPIEKVFDLEITTESGGGIISFPDLKPGTVRQFAMQIRVRNNTGKRYQVTQKVATGLVNKEGQAMPEGSFTVVTRAPKETRGTVKQPTQAAMKIGEIPLFVSDSKGSPDSFEVIYEINTPKDSKAGDYSSAVSFTLSEL